MSVMLDYYQLLGVPRNALQDDIRNAYFEAARRMHPDVTPDPMAQEEFLNIQLAYEVLSNDEKRKQYDATLGNSEFTPAVSIKMQYSRSRSLLNECRRWRTLLLEVASTGGPPDLAKHPR
jgi:DnaJ-class molecular chaperone